MIELHEMSAAQLNRTYAEEVLRDFSLPTPNYVEFEWAFVLKRLIRSGLRWTRDENGDVEIAGPFVRASGHDGTSFIRAVMLAVIRYTRLVNQRVYAGDAAVS